MALTVAASGTQTATLTTEHTLATVTDPGVYALNVDTANLANGETLTLRLKVKTLSGGTSRQGYEAIFKHAQSEPSKFSVGVPVAVELVATLQQDGGTGRAFPWSLMKL